MRWVDTEQSKICIGEVRHRFATSRSGKMTAQFGSEAAVVPSMDTGAGRRADSPHPVDLHVGVCIRMRRKELSISQERLAESLGITFQQVQKYERGANRVSASKLWEIALVLKTPVAYFYDGLGGCKAAAGHRETSQDFLLSS